MSTLDQALISSSSGASEFIVSLATNLGLGAATILVISLLRRTSFTYYFDVRRSDHIRNPNYTKGSVYYERPPRQSDTYFGWIWQTFAIPENVILRSAGLDAVIALRFYLRMGLYLTVYAIAAFIVLIPLQATSADNNGTTGFNALSILSIENGSSKLWAHLIFMYASTLLLFKILHSAWFETISLKQRWLSNQQLLGQRLTVLISRIPTQYSTSASLYALFQELYPDQIAGAYVVQSNPRLSELYELREDAVDRINSAKGEMELNAWSQKVKEQCENDQNGQNGQNSTNHRGDVSITRQIDAGPRPKMRLTMCGPKEVDVIDYYTDKLKHFDEEIALILGKIQDRQYSSGDIAGSTVLTPKINENRNNSNNSNNNHDDDDNMDFDEDDIKKFEITTPHVGFVTFKSAVAASSALNAPISESIRAFEMTLAPEPNDINWSGIYKSQRYKQIVSLLVLILVGIMVVFYTIPVTLISAILTVESLSQLLPWLAPVLTWSPIIKGIISGLLPSLAMLVFMALLPTILAGLGHLTGLYSSSEIEMFVFKKYFLFQFINFFLVACFSSTIFSEFNTVINEPSQIPVILASGLPQSALLFINYIQMRAFFSNIFGIVDIVDVIFNLIFHFFAKTPKSTASALKPTPEKYGKNLPESALIFIIAYTFGTIQPMMLTFAALYFFTIYFTKRFSLTWISVNPYQTGGGFWPLLFNRIMVGVVVGQLCVLGLLALKEQPIQSLLMIPLILTSIAYWYRYSSLYESTEHRLTLISARVTDSAISALNDEQRQALAEGYELPSGPAYLSLLPFLIPDHFGDTRMRQSALKSLGVTDMASKPQVSLYDSVFDKKVTVRCHKKENCNDQNTNPGAHFDENGNDEVTLSRDFLYLPEQYHGDDLSMDSKYKDWLQKYDLATNPPRDVLISSFLPLSWVRRYNSESNAKNIQDNNLLLSNSSLLVPDIISPVDNGRISTSINDVIAQDSDISSEDELLDSTKLNLEQRILIQQQVFRWKRSKRIVESITANSTNVITGNSSLESIDGDNDQNDDDIEVNLQEDVIIRTSNNTEIAITQLPLPSLHELPSESVILNPFILQRKNTLTRLEKPAQTRIGGETGHGNDVGVGDMEIQTNQTELLKVKGVRDKQIIPAESEMDSIMMRYFTPETNPMSYSNVAYRVWGNTYLLYKALKEQHKIEKKNNKNKNAAKNDTKHEKQLVTGIDKQPTISL
jgi:hypothetical protein